jgi:hypothetical protein
MCLLILNPWETQAGGVGVQEVPFSNCPQQVYVYNVPSYCAGHGHLAIYTESCLLRNMHGKTVLRKCWGVQLHTNDLLPTRHASNLWNTLTFVRPCSGNSCHSRGQRIRCGTRKVLMHAKASTAHVSAQTLVSLEGADKVASKVESPKASLRDCRPC